MQLLVSDGIAGAEREALVDNSTGAREPDLGRIVQRRGGPFFDDVERLAVDNPDFVQRMDLAVGRHHRAVSQETYAFDLSATAAEIRFGLGDDDVGAESRRGHASLTHFLE